MANNKTDLTGDLNVALVHYWLLKKRGGERVLETICKMLPQADIYTLFCNRDNIPDIFNMHKITTSFLQNFPLATRYYRNYLPLYPLAIEQFDLNGYDLVISSESGIAKGVLTNPETCHICYCHTPMRYAWNMYHFYKESLGPVKKFFFSPILHYIRMWDRLSADRVDYFIANSLNTRKRIKKYYRRESEVIYPPIDTEYFTPGSIKKDDGFYLLVSAMEPYKNIDLAIDAFRLLKKPLVVVGSGSHTISISQNDSINYIGQVTDEDLRDYYRNCKALIFPTEEDFGMVPLEAQACGKPVIAYGKGGALESVVDGKTGIFFSEQTPESLIEAVNKFEKMTFDPKVIRKNAERFSHKVFEDKFRKFVAAKYKEYNQA